MDNNNHILPYVLSNSVDFDNVTENCTIAQTLNILFSGSYVAEDTDQTAYIRLGGIGFEEISDATVIPQYYMLQPELTNCGVSLYLDDNNFEFDVVPQAAGTVTFKILITIPAGTKIGVYQAL